MALADDVLTHTDAVMSKLDTLLMGKSNVGTQTYSTTTTDSDPGAGCFRLNHATPSSATKLWPDNVDIDGASLTGILDGWDDSTSTVRGQLVIKSLDTPTAWLAVNVTGSVTDKTGYREVTIAWVGNGTGTFTAGDNFAYYFSRSGDGPVSDGDKGDVVVTSSGATWTIDANVVSDAKLRQSAGLSVVGRSANSTGNVADITAATSGHVLRLSGTTLGFGALIAASFADNTIVAARTSFTATNKLLGRVTASGGLGEEIGLASDVLFASGNLTIAAFTGDVAKSQGGTTLTIGTAVVTYAKIQDVAGLSVVGRASNSSGVSAAITAATDGHVLRLSGTTLGFGVLAAGAFADNTIVAARVSFTATNKLLGRATASGGAGEEIGLASDHEFSSTALRLAAWSGGDIVKSAGATSATIGAGKVTFSHLASALIDTDTTLAAASNSVLATQGAVKSYVDNLVQGLKWKAGVRVATTANGTLATAFENGDTVDGVTLATGDRILLKNQSSAAENGIYVVAASGAPARATDADTGAEMLAATCFVQEGTTNADTQWNCSTNAPITLGSTSLVFAQVSGGAGTSYTADETSLTLTSTTFSVKANGVTDAKLRQSAGLSIIGRSANSTGNVADITAATDGHVLRLSGTTLGFGTLAVGAFGANVITYAKIQQVSATSRFLGRVTAGAGDIEELTAANAATILGSAVNQPGKQSVWIAAGAMTSRTTNGPSAGTAESTTNKVMQITYDFDATTNEFAQFTYALPKSYNNSTVTFEALWLGGSAGDVIWGLQGVAISDNDAIDAAFGTAQEVTDTRIASNVCRTSESSAITIAGTPAAGDLVVFQVYRNAASASDTMTGGDAKLLGIRLFFTTNAANDA